MKKKIPMVLACLFLTACINISTEPAFYLPSPGMEYKASKNAYLYKKVTIGEIALPEKHPEVFDKLKEGLSLALEQSNLLSAGDAKYKLNADLKSVRESHYITYYLVDTKTEREVWRENFSFNENMVLGLDEARSQLISRGYSHLFEGSTIVGREAAGKVMGYMLVCGLVGNTIREMTFSLANIKKL